MRTIELESALADSSVLREGTNDDGLETLLGLWKLEAGGS